MRLQTYKKLIYYVKSTGTCIVVIGACWFFYQLRQASHTLRSVIPTNLLDLERMHAQYIYIDDPRFKDVFMFRDNMDPHASVSIQKRSLTYVIMKWWKSLNRNLAYRFLYMAQNGDKPERLRAMFTLNSMNYLRDWHYRSIAQMLDARTSVSLARMPHVDLRFFLKPPYYHVDHNLYDVIEKVHTFLLTLSKLCENTHTCLTQFLNKKFADAHHGGLTFDHDLATIGLSPAPAVIWDEDLALSCIQALCHHSSYEQYSKDIVEAGGLKILMMIKKKFSEKIDVCILLAKIMSNISLHTEYLQDIFQSGWIGTLVEWSHSSDIHLSAPAGRALANLDMDENDNVRYSRRIYLLHPLHKTRSPPKLDVVFLHGLLGGVFVTWRQRDCDKPALDVVDPCVMTSEMDTFLSVIDEHPQEFIKDLARDLQMREWKKLGQDFEVILDDCPENANCQAWGPYFCSGDDECVRKSEHDRVHKTQCWPKDWLPEDVPSLRIIGVNYDTNLSMWTPLCPIDSLKTTMKDRSDEYITKLQIAGLGKRPIMWVCHSMGGLLVKRMLVDEWKSGDKRDICKNTRGVFFYSTPHRGSQVAVLKQMTQMLMWPSVEVQELREQSPSLLQLHQEFLEFLKVYPIEIVSFSETKSTLVTALKFPFQFVTPFSADPGVGEFFEIPQDHLQICKPANRQSFLYQKLLSVLNRHVADEKKTPQFASVTDHFPFWTRFS